jgi:StAR-related lipid transfer protein 10
MPFFQVGEVRAATDEDVHYFIELCDTDQGWTEDYQKNDIVVFSQANNACSFRMVKLRAKLMDVSASVMYDVLHDPTYRKVWDKNMMEGREVCFINPCNDIGYYSIKSMAPFKNRDFVTQRSWLQTPEYSVIFNHSVFHKELPPKKDFIRAISHLAGYLIRPISSTACEVTYIAQCDPRGKLPAWAVNKSTRYLAPRVLRNLHKAARNYPTWKRKHNPDHKPWLYPEQCTVDRINMGDVLTQSDVPLDTLVDESAVEEAASSNLDDAVPDMTEGATTD